jgi:hypothetical protein
MDVTALSDVQLDHLIGQIGADPLNEDYDSVEALRREKRRRLAARSAANVEQDLEASAAPIAMEPVAGDGLRPKPTREQMDAAILAPITVEGKPIPGFDPSMGIGLSMSNPTDRAAYGQVFGDALRRHHQRGDAAARARRQGGYQDPEQVAYNEVTGAPGTYLPPQPPGMRGDTVMVDGVEVPAYRLSDGLPFGGMFREGDLRAAQEAAADADRLARFRANQDADRQKYGDWQGRTPEQAANYEARNDAVGRSVASASRARNRPGLQQLESDAKDRRRLIANRAMLAGGSSGLRGGPGGNMGMFTALAMLNGVDPENMDAQQQAMMQMLPINPTRADVEKAVLDRAAGLAARGIQGALAGNVENGATGDIAAQRRRDAALSQFEGWYQNTVGGWGTYTWDQHESAVNFLMNQYRLTRAEAEAIAQSRGAPRGSRPGSASAPSAPSVGLPVENEPGGLGTPM